MSNIQIISNMRRDRQRGRDLSLPNILAGEVKFGDCTGTLIFCLHLAPSKLMGVWLLLLWGVSCDSPFTLPIEEGANHGHLLSTLAWLTAPVQAVSAAAGVQTKSWRLIWFHLYSAVIWGQSPEENGKLFSSGCFVTSNLCVSFFSPLPLPPSCRW